MEKYRLVQEHKADPDEIPPSSSAQHTETSSALAFPEVRITQQGKPRNYISYAMNLFADGSNTITLKAMGRAMNKAVTIAEILKRKMPLHQWNVLSSVEMIDVYEPVEEGLDIVTNRRYVSCMTITLSISLIKDSANLSSSLIMDTNHSGYQPPLPPSEIHPRDYHHQHHQQKLISTS